MSTMPPDPDGEQDTPFPQTGHATALKFLDFIFDGVVGAFVEFQYFSSGRKPKHISQSTYLELPLNHDRINNEVLNRNGQQMITVGLAPRCRIPDRGRAGSNQDVLQVGCVWVNLNNARAQGGVIEIIRRIQNFPLRPSITVNSGYGYHVYFVFHEALRAIELVGWNDLIMDLRAAFGADTRTNLSEVMRLPGTLNIKEAHSVPCEISEEYSSWTRYSLEEVRKAVQESQSYFPLVEPAFSIEALRQRGLSSDVIEAIITCRTNQNAGIGHYGDGRDFRIASLLLEKDFDKDEIKAIFRSYPNGCGSNLARKRDGERYLELTISKAIRRSEPAGEVWEGDVEDSLDNTLPPGYVLKAGSIWYNPPVLDTDKKLPKPVLVCNSSIRIAGIQEKIDTGEISLSIAFDYIGKTRFVYIHRSEMADSRKLVSALAGAGAPVTSINARLVTAYLAAYEHAFASSISHKKLTSRFGRGRTGKQFFFPGLSSRVEFAPLSPGDAALYRAYSSRRGTLGGWLEVMHTLADEALMIPQVAILASFVPPLQSKLQIPNFILDIHGNSSTGKSTTLKLAASVYGRPQDPDSLVMQWMNTQVAVEQVAGLCSELPIYLDDAQHCPAEWLCT